MVRLPTGTVDLFLFSIIYRAALGLKERHVEWKSAVRSTRVKWPGRQADHLSPSGTDVGLSVLHLTTHICFHDLGMNSSIFV